MAGVGRAGGEEDQETVQVGRCGIAEGLRFALLQRARIGEFITDCSLTFWCLNTDTGPVKGRDR